MRTKKINDEVLYTEDDIVIINQLDLEVLKQAAEYNRRKRIRLCAHRDVEDLLHEMFIVHTRDTYVRPHKHLNKVESFHVIEGRANVILFDDNGYISRVIEMGHYKSNQAFYYRFADPFYHTLMIETGIFVFHETTNGPFRSTDTVFAPWAPKENKRQEVKAFMQYLYGKVEQMRLNLGD